MKNISKSFILTVIILSATLNISAAENYLDVLQSNEDFVIVRFELPVWNLEKLDVAGEVFDKIVCPAGVIRNGAGEPQVPGFTGIAGIPPDGDISLTVLSATPQYIRDVKLISVQETYLENDVLKYRYSTRDDIYAQNRFFPQHTVKRGNSAMAGNRRFCSFFIQPFQYNPAQEKLLYYNELTIRINILGSKERVRNLVENSILDKAGNSLLVNNDVSRFWRMKQQVQQNSNLRSGQDVNSFMITVPAEGIYKVSYEFIMNELAEFEGDYIPGFNWNTIDPRYLQLTDNNGSVPVYFYGEADGSFDEGDYFEFYGDINHGETAWYDDYGTDKVYFLKFGEQLGSRMMIENGGLIESNQNNFTSPESFEQTVHIEHQSIKEHLGAQALYNVNYFREDMWFWGSIMAPNLADFQFDLQYPHASNIRKASARVCLMGLTFDDRFGYYNSPTVQNLHRAIVRVNSAIVDDIGSNGEWLGQREQIFENMGYENSISPILNSELNHGENNLSVSLPNLENQYEKVLLDYLELTYWREYKTDTDEIKFHKPIRKPIGIPQPGGLYQFDIEGFSSEDVSIYKLGSSMLSNLTVTALNDSGYAPYRISFQDSVFSDETKYLALTEDMKKEPLSIIPDYSSNLQSSINGAEYIIITVREFGEGATALAEFWEEYDPSLTVEVVYVQDIFDEFNYGQRSAQAIKDFLNYSFNNWFPRPCYCLLLGEGLLDERSNNPYRWANKIPTKVIWFRDRGATASDNWFGCLTGNDIVSDMIISRLNVTQESQLATIIEKTQHYMTEKECNDLWHSSITMATGGTASEGNVFSMQSERIKQNSIPPEYRITRVYCNIQDMPESYSGNTTTLINAINDGSLYVQFMGHGASHQWDDYDLFDMYDVDNLNNENLFIASSMSCYGSAFFDEAGESCIGEALTLDAQGAIAHIGFTGFGYLNQDETYARALLAALTNTELETIGEIIEYTKIRFYAESIFGAITLSLLHGSALLGDPMIKIIRPEVISEISTDKFNYALGDSLFLQAAVEEDIEAGRFYLYDENDSQVSANEFYPFTYQAENGFVRRNTEIADASILPEGTYNRIVKFAGYSEDREIVGITNFAIGLGGAYDIRWEPQQPDPNDEVEVTGSFYDEDGIENVSCYIRVYSSNHDPFNPNSLIFSYYYEDMVWEEETERYRLQNPIPAFPFNYSVRMEFTITDSLGNESICQLLPNQSYYRITGVKFLLSDFSITSHNNQAAGKISIKNNGNRDSESCDLKLYLSNTMELLDSLRIDSLQVGEQRWEYLELPELNGNYSFTLRLNEDEEFPGSAVYLTDDYNLLIFSAGIDAKTITSPDSNLVCEFPQNLLNENAVFMLLSREDLEALNQPDIEKISMHNGYYSTAYELVCFNEGLLADSLGTFSSEGRVNFTFNYSPSRAERANLSEDRFSVYRWNEKYEKWVFKSIGANTAENTVSLSAARTGIYSIFENQDFVLPSIDVNVEGQDFTFGGYVSQNGLVSFLLADKNGIDVIENELSFYIDGTLISEEDYSINRAKGSLTSVPVKYQLSLIDEGIHYLQMSCLDFNGNVFNRELTFEVKADFDLINVANYPNPVKSLTIDPINTGRTRFTYVLTDDADEVEIKIYTVSGRLVKSFENLSATIGYHEFPYSNIGWDCRDEEGDILANGVYFYKVIARKGGNTIERIQKLAILR